MNIWDPFALQIDQHYLSKHPRDSYLCAEDKCFLEQAHSLTTNRIDVFALHTIASVADAAHDSDL